MITIDEFFEIPLTVRDHEVYAGETPLVCGDAVVRAEKVDAGSVG